MQSKTLWVLVVIVLAGSFAGCNKFTRERYETIYVGQPADIVEKTLGKPYVKFSDTWTYEHNDAPYYKAVIMFKDGRVIGRSWYDEREMGDHPDSKFRGKGETTIESHTTTVVE